MERIQLIYDKTTNFRPRPVGSKFYLLNGEKDDTGSDVFAYIDETPGTLQYDVIQTKSPKPEVSFAHLGTSGIHGISRVLKQNIPEVYEWLPSVNGKIKHDFYFVDHLNLPKHVILSGEDIPWVKSYKKVLLDKLMKRDPEMSTANAPPSEFGSAEVEELDRVQVPETDQNKPGLMDMPLEIFENIIPHLDGVSFLNTCEASLELNTVMWEAFGSNPAKCSKYWQRTCLRDLNKQQLHRILASYDCVVERSTREVSIFDDAGGVNVDADSDDETYPNYDPLDAFTWKDILFSAYKLWETIFHGKTTIINMEKLELKIKTDIQLAKEEPPVNHYDNEYLIRQKITRITQTCGSFALNILCPFKPSRRTRTNVRIFEDLDKVEMRRSQRRLCKENIHFVKVMFLPQINPQSLKLPFVIRVLISVCDICVSLRALQEGSVHRIVLDSPVVEGGYCRMEPIIAINEDVFVLWNHPYRMALFRVTIDEENKIDHETLKVFYVNEIVTHWMRIAEYREFYIPVLEKVNGSDEEWTRDQIRRFSIEELEKDYYRFKMVSFGLGNDIMSERNPVQNQYHNHPVHVLLHEWPKYYAENALETKELFHQPYSAAQGYGMFAVWNDLALAISWNGTTWLIQTFENALESVKDVDIKKVTHVELFCPDGIIVAINGGIFIFEIQVNTVRCKRHFHEIMPESCKVAIEPRLKLIPIRWIRLNLRKYHLKLDTMTFDYSLGKPYIFLTIKKKRPKDVLDFYIKRIEFHK